MLIGLLVSLLPNVISQSSSFLQKDPQTSSGYLAQGISTVNDQVIILSDEISNSLQLTKENLAAQVKLTATSAEYILQEAISNRLAQLQDIQQQISDLEDLIAITSDCPGALTCNSCTANSACVWCEMEKICVSGDQGGPLNGECSAFQYKSCRGLGCAGYTECSFCIADVECGYCELGGQCMEGSKVDSGGCPAEYFYRRDILQRSTCPQIQYKPMQSRPVPNDLPNQLAELQEVEKTLEEQIEFLDSQRKVILRRAAYIDSVQLWIYNEYDDLKGLIEQVDNLKQQEIDNMKETIKTNAENFKDTVNQAVQQEVESSAQQIVDLINTSTEAISSLIPAQGQLLTSELNIVTGTLQDEYQNSIQQMNQDLEEAVESLSD